MFIQQNAGRVGTSMKQSQSCSTTPKFISTQQLACRWGIHPITLRRWRSSGKITATRLGRGVRFAIAEVERIEKESVETFC